MTKPTTVRLTPEAEAGLAWLRDQPGGFVLQSTVSKWIIEEARKRGMP